MHAALVRLAGHLPLRFLHAVGALAGRLAYRFSAGYRHKIDHFSAHAGHTEPAFRRAAVMQGGKALAEIPWMWTQPSTVTTARMTATGWDAVERAHAAGKGILFMTPHLGCFEGAAQYYAVHGGPITVLYSPPRQPWLRKIVDSARARANLHTAPATLAGVRQLAKALKRGEAVGILPDQVPGPNEGIWAEFFGQAAYTMTLPAKLQLLTGATVVLAYAERLDKGRGFCVHFYAHDEAFTNDTLDQARTINRAMERLIAIQPTQYMWGYNRFKVPAGVNPPPADLTTQRAAKERKA